MNSTESQRSYIESLVKKAGVETFDTILSQLGLGTSGGGAVTPTQRTRTVSKHTASQIIDELKKAVA